jgi:thiol-disulfide isomerase/thioredoxin/mono/diheme cytochrome c family protein
MRLSVAGTTRASAIANVSVVLAALAVVAFAVAGEQKSAPPSAAPVGVKLADWTLPRVDAGKSWSLAVDGRDAKAVVVAFIGTECPISNAYAPVLAGLAKEYAAKGVLFIGVNSNRQDDAAAVAKHVKEFSITFPVLKDDGTTLADRFLAKRTPEVFVLDGTRTVRYRGRIDDQMDKGSKRPKAQNRELVDALDSVLAGKEVSQAVTTATGCVIGRGPKAKSTAGTAEAVTYAKQVSRIIQKNCQQCHRPGEAAPFKLMKYGDAAAWSEPIREALTQNRMPPWGADPAHGKFKNDRSLTEGERSSILAWIDQGCPEGDPADLPQARTYPEGWQYGQPDEIFQLKEEVKVPAEAPQGGLPYQYLLVGDEFKEDRWVQAIEVHPGVRAVVHHILVFVRPPKGDKPKTVAAGGRRPRRPRPEGPPNGERQRWPRSKGEEELFSGFDPGNPDGFGELFLAGYAPGAAPTTYPAGMGKKIVKGSQLIFEIHYTPNGTACADRSLIGLTYCKETPKHEIHTRTVMEPRFAIPPLVSRHRVDSTTTYDRPVVLLNLAPHMHLRGTDFAFYLAGKDGKKETLLSVPKFNFNWQTFYELAEPRRLPAGARIDCVAHFDNSTSNPNNPNPWQIVTWGPQTWDEMMLGFVDYYYDDVK